MTEALCLQPGCQGPLINLVIDPVAPITSLGDGAPGAGETAFYNALLGATSDTDPAVTPVHNPKTGNDVVEAMQPSDGKLITALRKWADLLGVEEKRGTPKKANGGLAPGSPARGEYDRGRSVHPKDMRRVIRYRHDATIETEGHEKYHAWQVAALGESKATTEDQHAKFVLQTEWNAGYVGNRIWLETNLGGLPNWAKEAGAFFLTLNWWTNNKTLDRSRRYLSPDGGARWLPKGSTVETGYQYESNARTVWRDRKYLREHGAQ